jgi:hypothetical protein
MQELKTNDQLCQRDFCTNIMNHLEEDNLLLDKTVFGDEATFYLTGRRMNI